MSSLSFVSPAAADAGVDMQPEVPCLTVEGSETDAITMAVRCQTRVQITDATTETDQAFALPDGTVEFEHRYRPVRVARDGDWIPVDTTLQVQADGSLAPTAAAADVAFSGGGTDPMVSVQNDDGEVALSSPWGALPTPTLAGNTATYREVRPGIDLRLTADVDGFSQVFVVKTREAAKDSALNKLNFVMETDGLVVAANKSGNLKVTDAETGRIALTASTPVMWDSDTTAAPTPAAALSIETVSDSDKARMPVTVDTDTMSITPDQKMLDSPDTKFPVYVDPSFTTYRTGFVMVTASSPTSAYFNTADDALVGSNNGVNRWRTFFNFSTATAPFVGKQVTSADLRLQEKWSGSCTPTPFDAYATYAASSTTTWNNQPTWSTKQDTQIVAKGYSPSGVGGSSACPAGEVRMSITPITQQAAINGGNITIGLRSPDETKVSHWKRFENNPKISVIYNSTPELITQLTDSTGKCVAGTGRPTLATTTPTLFASYSDADSTPTTPTTTTTTFEWWSLNGSAAIGSGTQSSVPVGTNGATIVPSGQLATGGTYKWHVKASDGSSTTAWSSWCEFAVNTALPAPTLVDRSTEPETGCVTGTSRPQIDTLNPGLYASFAGAEANELTTTFEWSAVDSNTVLGTGSRTGVGSGETTSFVIPHDSLANGRSYKWRVMATNGTSTSTWSTWCEFTVTLPAGWDATTGPTTPLTDDTTQAELAPCIALAREYQYDRWTCNADGLTGSRNDTAGTAQAASAFTPIASVHPPVFEEPLPGEAGADAAVPYYGDYDTWCEYAAVCHRVIDKQRYIGETKGNLAWGDRSGFRGAFDVVIRNSLNGRAARWKVTLIWDRGPQVNFLETYLSCHEDKNNFFDGDCGDDELYPPRLGPLVTHTRWQSSTIYGNKLRNSNPYYAAFDTSFYPTGQSNSYPVIGTTLKTAKFKCYGTARCVF